MTLTAIIAEVLVVFNGLPAELLLVITATAVVGAASMFFRRILRAGR